MENGQEAIDAWAARHGTAAAFDLLLLDITMPVLDGLSALVEIRRLEREAGESQVPAVAVTANAMPHQVADYILGGFDSHLAKPFKHKELIHAIKTLIRRDCAVLRGKAVGSGLPGCYPRLTPLRPPPRGTREIR